MRFLFIDTSTDRGVIAFIDQQEVLFARELPFGSSQSKFLMPYLVEALEPYGHPPSSLNAIGVGIGPGSYTGIRLGVSVAQTLAYSWKVPLVGVSSLNGFVPFESHVHFAAILDARIGGVYLRKGWSHESEILFQGEPQIYSLEEAGIHLQEVTHLVTSSARSLQAKLSLHYPNHQWTWQERSPSVPALAQSLEKLYSQGKVIFPPQTLDLLYLRKTEAELTKNKAKS